MYWMILGATGLTTKCNGKSQNLTWSENDMTTTTGLFAKVQEANELGGVASLIRIFTTLVLL